MCVVCVHTQAIVHVWMWRPEDNLWESQLSFYHVILGDQIQVIRLGSQAPYQLSHLVSL